MMDDGAGQGSKGTKRLWHKRWLQALIGVFLLGLIAAAFFLWRLSRQVNLVGFTSRGQQGEISLPAGFEINTFAQGLEGPRFIAFGPDGHLYVAERGADRIVRLPDADQNGRADQIEVYASDLNAPHSLAFHEGAWYIGVPTGVVRLEDTDGDGQADQRRAIIDDYPTGGHNTRTVLFLPDGRMAVSVGSSCNVCLEEDERRAAIVSYQDADGSSEQLLATGLRNAVGLTVQPGTGELWVTNNGRDFLGDDQPPDTVWRIEEGQNYGWPHCHAGRIADPEYGHERSCQGVPSPPVEIQAHSAPLGLIFYDGEQFPAEYRGDLFIAFHGSWNRSVPTGYKIVRVDFEDFMPADEPQEFADGWLSTDGKQVSGRPVGLAIDSAGALYVSDDAGGFIYRITYQGQ